MTGRRNSILGDEEKKSQIEELEDALSDMVDHATETFDGREFDAILKELDELDPISSKRMDASEALKRFYARREAKKQKVCKSFLDKHFPI